MREASRSRLVDREGEGSHTRGPWLPTKRTRRLPMELMLAHPLVLPDEALGLAELEAAVRPPAACPACGSAATAAAGHKERRVEAVFGPVRLRRARRRCGGCGAHFQPDDAALATAIGAGRCTPK